MKRIIFALTFFSFVAIRVQAQEPEQPQNQTPPQPQAQAQAPAQQTQQLPKTQPKPQTQSPSGQRFSPAEEKLNRLMSEREQLIMEYQFFNQQNSNFWGNKSKDDLMNIIETLKKVINTDSDIIAAVKEVSIRRLAESAAEIQREGEIMMGDERNINAQMEGYKSEIRTLQTDIKKRERSMKELEAQLADTNELRYGKDKVIAILAVGSFILLLYAVALQVRLNKLSSKGKKKKA